MWIIAILAGLAVLLLFILWVPLDMVLQADFDGKPKFRLRFLWLFGLVSRDITDRKKKPEEKKKAPGAKKKRRWVDAGVMFKILRTRGFFSHIGRFIRDVLVCFRFRDIAADFKVGLGDPADTGLLFAFLGPASVFLGSSQVHQMRIEPSFGDDAILEGYSRVMVRLRPIRLVPPFFKLTFSLTTIRIAWTLITNKWKRKKK